MKQLEDKIKDVFKEKLSIGISGGTILGRNQASEIIAKEIKDIAIEFNKWVWEYNVYNPLEEPNYAQQFDQFIKERYKP